MSVNIKNVAKDIWTLLKTVFFAALLFASAIPIMVVTIVLHQNEGGFLYGGSFIDIAYYIVALLMCVYAAYYVADYLKARQSESASHEHTNQEERRWLERFMPPIKWINRIALLGIGFALAMAVVSERIGKRQAWQEREILKQANQLNYLVDQPAFIYYFAEAGEAASAISNAEFRSNTTQYLVSTNNQDELMWVASRFYNEAMEAADINLVEVVGFAGNSDNVGNSMYLSRKRAMVIRDMLIRAGVPEVMISVRSAGARMHECVQAKDGVRHECHEAVEVYMKGDMRG